MHDQTRAVTVDPDKAGRVIGDFAEHHGLPRRECWAPAEAVELLTRMGYDVSPGVIAEFVRKGYVSDPGDVLDATALYCLTGALEARRRWLPAPSLHDWKKSGIRLELERLKAQGIDPPIHDLDKFTVEDLLLQLTGSDNRAEREGLYEALRLKLSGYEE